MNLDLIRIGLKVKTSPEVKPGADYEQTKGMMINEKHLIARRPNAEGTIRGYVGGHGGDVWWVEHSPDDVAAYVFTEFEEVQLNA